MPFKKDLMVKKALKTDTLWGQMRLWSIMLVLLPSTLMMVFFAVFELDELRRQRLEQLDSMITAQHDTIDRWFDDKRYDIQRVAESKPVRAHHTDEMLEVFRFFTAYEGDFDSVVFVNKHGRTEVSWNGREGIDVSDRPYFKAAKEGNAFITDVIIGRDSGIPLIIVAAPVYDYERQFRGLVFGSIRMTTIDAIMRQFRQGQTGETFLMNQDGLIISESRFSEFKQGRFSTIVNSEAYLKARDGNSGMGIYTDYRGQRVLGAYHWLPERKWIIVGKIDEWEVLRPFYRQLVIMGAGFLIVIAITLPLTLQMANRIKAPIEWLIQRTKTLQSGQHERELEKKLLISGPQELRELCITFNSMAQTIQVNMEQLRESNEALKVTEAKYRHLSAVDGLTEVANRRTFDRCLDMEWERAKRNHLPIVLIMMDVDCFKAYNDTYGHQAGDDCLRQVASTADMVIQRPGDIIARYGGEEFAVILPNTDGDGAASVAEKIRVAVEQLQIPHEASNVADYVTVSLGIATVVPGTGCQSSDLVFAADKAMYLAKQAGRNRIETTEVTACSPNNM